MWNVKKRGVMGINEWRGGEWWGRVGKGDLENKIEESERTK